MRAADESYIIKDSVRMLKKRKVQEPDSGSEEERDKKPEKAKGKKEKTHSPKPKAEDSPDKDRGHRGHDEVHRKRGEHKDQDKDEYDSDREEEKKATHHSGKQQHHRDKERKDGEELEAQDSPAPKEENITEAKKYKDKKHKKGTKDEDEKKGKSPSVKPAEGDEKRKQGYESKMEIAFLKFNTYNMELYDSMASSKVVSQETLIEDYGKFKDDFDKAKNKYDELLGKHPTEEEMQFQQMANDVLKNMKRALKQAEGPDLVSQLGGTQDILDYIYDKTKVCLGSW